jgi:phasin family protein
VTDDTIDAGRAAKPRKPRVVQTAAAVANDAAVRTGAGAVAAATFAASAEQFAEKMEAATSPAVQSDAIAAPAEAAAHATEELTEMATIAPTPTPTETADKAADKAQAVFGDVSGRMKSAFDKSSKLGEEMVDFAKGNVEAMIASARVAAKAGETLGQDAAEYGKKNFESATQALKSFATVKSPTELFQLQSEYAKAQFDSAVAEMSKASESIMKLAGEIAQPISNRVALAAEKLKASSTL